MCPGGGSLLQPFHRCFQLLTDHPSKCLAPPCGVIFATGQCDQRLKAADLDGTRPSSLGHAAVANSTAGGGPADRGGVWRSRLLPSACAWPALRAQKSLRMFVCLRHVAPPQCVPQWRPISSAPLGDSALGRCPYTTARTVRSVSVHRRCTVSSRRIPGHARPRTAARSAPAASHAGPTADCRS